jgi:hypothetical protein
MESNLKDNGKTGKKMGLEFGNHQKETIMKEDGKITSKMVKDYLYMLGVLHIRDSLRIS